MSSRLSQMTEESLSDGGRGAQRTIEEAGVPAELKASLERRLLDSSFRSENAAAFSQLDMPVRRLHAQHGGC